MIADTREKPSLVTGRHLRFWQSERTRVFLVALVVISVPIAALFLHRGEFTYPLDDTFIHMAIARTLATSHIWGVNAADSASASSSPGYTILLTLFYFFSQGHFFLYAPLLFNILAAAALVFFVAQYPKQPKPNWLAVIVVIISQPLFVLPALGMEHVLQTLACVLAISVIPAAIAGERRLSFLAAFLISMFATSIRYESVALFMPLIMMAAIQRRGKIAVGIVAGIIVPVAGFGLLWMNSGGGLLPNSIRLKSDVALQGFLTSIVANVSQAIQITHSSGITLAAVGLYLIVLIIDRFYCYFKEPAGSGGVLRKALRQPQVIVAIAVSAAILAQFSFGKMGWLFRYEAWLVTLGGIAILGLVSDKEKSQWKFRIALLALFLPRAWQASASSWQALADRQREHLVVAHFIADRFPTATIMDGDIGAVSWFAPQARVIDLYGLGNNEIAQARLMPGGLTADRIEALAAANHAQFAVVQLCWRYVSSFIPQQWVPLRLWHLPGNVAFDLTAWKNDWLAFYAPAAGSVGMIEENFAGLTAPEGVDATPVRDPAALQRILLDSKAVAAEVCGPNSDPKRLIARVSDISRGGSPLK